MKRTKWSLKKGVLAVLSTTCLLSAIMSGCGQTTFSGNVTTEGTTAKTTEQSTTQAGTIDTSQPVELTWYYIGTGQQEGVGEVEEEINKYLKEKTNLNATVKLYCFDYGSYPQKIQAMIAAGEPFDICFTSSWANNYYLNARKGAFVALNDLIPAYAPKTFELIDPGFIKGTQIDGINYAVPTNKEAAHQWGFVIRKDIIDKYNMDISTIKKFEDIEPFLKIVKENEPGMYPLEAVIGESPFRVLDFDRIGDQRYPGVVYNDSQDMKVFNELEAPETLAFFETMHKFYEAGYIREDAATVTDYTQDQKAGKVFAAIRSLKPGKDIEESNTFGYELVQVPVTPPVKSNAEMTGSLQAISSTSKKPERALMFLELVNTDPVLNNMINYGIEGKHYIKVSDNVIKAGPELDKYNPGTGWVFGNQFISYVWDNEAPDKWQQFLDFNKQAIETKTLGFVFDAEPVKTQIAQCVNVWDQYMPGLETGTVDPHEVLPEFIKALKDAGADEIIAEKQKQLDEWLARQN